MISNRTQSKAPVKPHDDQTIVGGTLKLRTRSLDRIDSKRQILPKQQSTHRLKPRSNKAATISTSTVNSIDCSRRHRSTQGIELIYEATIGASSSGFQLASDQLSRRRRVHRSIQINSRHQTDLHDDLQTNSKQQVPWQQSKHRLKQCDRQGIKGNSQGID